VIWITINIIQSASCRSIESMTDNTLFVAGTDHLLTLGKERCVEALRQDGNLLVRLS
jgi:hypothetical protein